jgi:transglutaminase-like putative cysteine protease
VIERLALGKPLIRFLGRIEPQSLVSLALLLTTLGCVSYGLPEVVDSLDTQLLLSVAALGLLAGWTVGMSRLSGGLVLLVGIVLGIAVAVLRVGHLGGAVLAVLAALVGLAWQSLDWARGGVPPAWTSALWAFEKVGYDAGTLLGRCWQWVLLLVAGGSPSDPVATSLLWSLALWLAAFWAGWAVRRHNWPLLAVIPGGVLLAVPLALGEGQARFLLPLLGALLLLLAVREQKAREGRWQSTGTTWGVNIRRPVLVWASLLSLTLVALAALLPSMSVRDIIDLLRPRILVYVVADQDNQLGWGMDPLLGEPLTVFSDARVIGLPRSHLLGSAPELSDQVIMTVAPDDLEPDMRLTPRGHYWRSLTYDRYSGLGWSTSESDLRMYEAGQPLITGTLSPQRLVWQDVELQADMGGLLHAAGAFVTVDRDFYVAWRSPYDVFGAYSASDDLVSYRLSSLVPAVDEATLRSAGGDYPEWVRDCCLALPDRVPDRVIALARDLTATAPTPYDRAVAIESYLRTFPYSLEVPLPSPRRDVVDYFLFDLRQGYCDYYATAMVVLARAAGLPARLVVGYASGSYDPDNARFVVVAADAHAWAEVYFPGYGWIEFEPTAGQRLFERTVQPFQGDDQSGLDRLGAGGISQGVPELNPQRTGMQWWPGILVSLALLTALGSGWLAVDIWRLRRATPGVAISLLYQRLRRSGQQLGVPVRDGATPYEFGFALARHLDDLAQGAFWEVTLGSAPAEVQRLVEWYVQANYTPRPVDDEDRLEAIRLWRALRARMWFALVASLVPHPSS